MIRLLAILLSAVLFSACNTEIEQERNCRLTTDGWVCRDAGMTDRPDTSLDDMSTSSDLGGSDLTLMQDTSILPDEGMAEPDMPEPPGAATSCAQLLLRGEATGRHSIELNGSTTEVYCDMDTANGGWMLVARSAAGGASGSFGWRSSTGTLDDTGQPYSLAPVDFAFTELLVGAHDGGYTWGDRVYRTSGLNDFWASCQTTACNVAVTPVAGNCNDIAMLNFAGYNDESSRFFFRDLADVSTQGLHPDGFQVFYDDCRGGELQGRQGMIFVR